MKYLFIFFILLVPIIYLTSNVSIKQSNNFNPKKYNTITTCSNSNDTPSKYTTLDDGDTIVRNNDKVKIHIFHDKNKNKKICATSGLAYLIKNIHH